MKIAQITKWKFCFRIGDESHNKGTRNL